MSANTIRLPDELKARIVVAAKRAGVTSHEFIMEAITGKVDRVEGRARFDALAARRYADFVESGKSIPWDVARRYLEDRIAGKLRRRPVARKLT